jgi:hypothetical protein
MRGILALCMLVPALAAALPSVAASGCAPDGPGVSCTLGPQPCEGERAPLPTQSGCADCSVLAPSGTSCTAKACVAGVHAGASTSGVGAGNCDGLVRDALRTVAELLDDVPRPVAGCQVGTPLGTAYCTGVLERCTIGFYALESVTEC